MHTRTRYRQRHTDPENMKDGEALGQASDKAVAYSGNLDSILIQHLRSEMKIWTVWAWHWPMTATGHFSGLLNCQYCEK